MFPVPRPRRWRAAAVIGTALAMVVSPMVATTATAAPAPKAQDLAQWVDPYIGTQPGDADMGTGGGAANTFPGADVPFGMVQWSPDTVTLQHGGYYYQDNRIKGFSLTHLSGAGCDTYQDIPFMPVVGDITDSPAANPMKYISTFSHSNEKVTAGSYGVNLDNGAKVELSATQRTGAGRFTWPVGPTSTLLVNVSGSIMGTDDASVTIGKNYISGYAASGHFCGADDHYRVYFYAQFDQNFASTGTWHNGAVTPGKDAERGMSLPKAPVTSAPNTANAKSAKAKSDVTSQSVKPQDTTVSGPGSGAYVTFDNTKSPTVNVKVGVSFVSVDGAKANIKAENPDKTFDQVAAAARASWNSRLNQIAVTGGTNDQKTIFYTALYHSLLQPNVFSDSDGQYPGFDGQLHKAAKGHAIYTNFSGWDIYRSEAQLLALLAPSETSDIANSMVQFAAQGGSWDRWTVANDYTGVMNGDPYHIIVSTAYAFGAKGFDANQALLLMERGASQPTVGYEERPGLANYLKLGYVPGVASDTLEYTSADFSIAQLARRLGDSATYNTFIKRAQNWQNLYNPATGYLQPRAANGSFGSPFNPADPGGYTEGNGAQYVWMVPYNYSGLITALGGNDAVNKRLDDFFTKLNAGPSDPHAFLGNEPTLQTPWIYDYTGAPYKTQALVNQIRQQIWKAGPNGLVGNDDLGEMSSWYVWASLGLYPEIPGRAELTLNTPEFTGAVITRPGGQKITINAPGASTSTPYIDSLKLNGQTWTKPWLPESFVNTGGTLDFSLSSTPNTSWGSAHADAPPSFTDGAVNQSTFVDPSRLVAPAGGTANANVGVQDLSGQGTTVHWTATAPAGLTITPSSGDLTTDPGGKASTPVTVTVAAGTAEQTYNIPISYTAGGKAINGSTLAVLVAQPGSLRATFNNVGTSPDDNQQIGNFDGGGWSYSRNALAAKGVNPGSTITDSDGLKFVWPNVPVGELDNVNAGGQTINIDAPAGATQLSLLGSAGNGNASGTLTITYTDGTTQNASVGFSDWALGGGGAPVAYNNRTVVTMPYRNAGGGTSQQLVVYLFATAPIALQAGKQVKSITLPGTIQGGTFHVFSIAVG
ncbi:GH92 family glycosyl hydrolase [Kutzneria kofuensis]|uniref:Putative alpha-1,2-mannosidase n=2 Tax=Kutzneria kofuensis TaxID=103725 RepID=A0A7W9KJT5_9PSEU|nr:GH92 family glycosyl hydrolase [Kutzneria kofuensis]MBB5893912.1 putative alpha-1,2-mannosidase [Kutzneria kofuensis]